MVGTGARWRVRAGVDDTAGEASVRVSRLTGLKNLAGIDRLCANNQNRLRNLAQNLMNLGRGS